MRSGCCLALCCMLVGVAAAPAQKPQAAHEPREVSPARRAGRLLTFLELPARRSAAARELLRLGAAAVPSLERGIRHPRREVALTCMHLLRELGPTARRALPALSALADGEDPELSRAAQWARSRLVPRGITLLAEYQAGRIRELDATGKEICVIGKLKSVWDVEKLANGNYLVTRYNQKKAITELTPKGAEVWSFGDVKMPLDADRLPDGHTLISDTYGNRVIEVDPRGKIVWTYKGPIQPYDADRLPGGNTLICDYRGGKVIEVDRSGATIWKVTVANPFGADRLPNGNTLICQYGKNRVIEVDAAGRIVAQLDGLEQPNEARRLPNGHTLVAENRFVREFDKAGKEVWRLKTKRVGGLQRY